MSRPLPRLTPVEKPSSPWLRVIYAITRRQFGVVIGAVRVIYARKPSLAPIAALIQRTLEHGLTLDPGLRLLIQVQASRLNGCAFCEDLALAQAVRARLGRERFDALDDYRTSTLFTERERAALDLTREAVERRGVADGTFERARAHFNETELVELCWVAAAESYFNVQAHALGVPSDHLAGPAPEPGRPGGPPGGGMAG